MPLPARFRWLPPARTAVMPPSKAPVLKIISDTSRSLAGSVYSICAKFQVVRQEHDSVVSPLARHSASGLQASKRGVASRLERRRGGCPAREQVHVLGAQVRHGAPVLPARPGRRALGRAQVVGARRKPGEIGSVQHVSRTSCHAALTCWTCHRSRCNRSPRRTRRSAAPRPPSCRRRTRRPLPACEMGIDTAIAAIWEAASASWCVLSFHPRDSWSHLVAAVVAAARGRCKGEKLRHAQLLR